MNQIDCVPCDNLKVVHVSYSRDWDLIINGIVALLKECCYTWNKKINFCYSCEHANLINFLFSFLLLIVMSSRRLVRISENFFFICRRVCFLSSSNFSLNIHKNLIILFIQIYSKKINFLIYWSRMTTRFICVTSLNIANFKLWKKWLFFIDSS